MNNEQKTPQATVTVRKNGHSIRRFVRPAVSTGVMSLTAGEIRESLRRNERLILVDDHNQHVLDIFNILTQEGKLQPCCRMLAPFIGSCHYESKMDVTIAHRGAEITRQEYKELVDEARAKAARERRSSVVPRRYVRVRCKQCGYINEVDLTGFGN